MRISDWSSDVCSSDLRRQLVPQQQPLLTACPFDQHHRRRAQRLAHMAEVPVATLRLEDMAAGDGRLAARHAGKAVEAAVEVGGKPGTRFADRPVEQRIMARSEEHTSELQSLMRISYAVFCLKKKKSRI